MHTLVVWISFAGEARSTRELIAGCSPWLTFGNSRVQRQRREMAQYVRESWSKNISLGNSNPTQQGRNSAELTRKMKSALAKQGVQGWKNDYAVIRYEKRT